jgi:hypothetical protein
MILPAGTPVKFVGNTGEDRDAVPRGTRGRIVGTVASADGLRYYRVLFNDRSSHRTVAPTDIQALYRI